MSVTGFATRICPVSVWLLRYGNFRIIQRIISLHNRQLHFALGAQNTHLAPKIPIIPGGARVPYMRVGAACYQVTSWFTVRVSLKKAKRQNLVLTNRNDLRRLEKLIRPLYRKPVVLKEL